jgi:hypothetical protein
MNSGFKTRAKKIEDRVLVGTDRQEFERLRRRFYNTRGVTTATLLAEILSILRQTEEPVWARAELERAIPADADKQRLVEAEARARDIVSGRPPPEVDEPWMVEEITKLFHEHGLTGGLDTLDPQIEEIRDRELGPQFSP